MDLASIADWFFPPRANPSDGGKVDGVDYTAWFASHSADDCFTLDLGRDKGGVNIPAGSEQEAMRVASRIATGTGEVFNSQGMRVVGPTRVRVFKRTGGRETVLLAEFAAGKSKPRNNPAIEAG